MGAIYKDGKFYNTRNSSKNYDEQIQDLKKRIQILESTDFTSEDAD